MIYYPHLAESLDNPQFQEASVSGHILLLLLRDRLETTLLNARKKIEIIAGRKENYTFTRYDTAFSIVTAD